jgi:hypothetical protein
LELESGELNPGNGFRIARHRRVLVAKFLDDSAPNNRFRASYELLMMAICFKPPAPPEIPDVDRFPMPELPPKVGE